MLVDADGRALLADFGLSTMAEELGWKKCVLPVHDAMDIDSRLSGDREDPKVPATMESDIFDFGHIMLQVREFNLSLCHAFDLYVSRETPKRLCWRMILTITMFSRRPVTLRVWPLRRAGLITDVSLTVGGHSFNDAVPESPSALQVGRSSNSAGMNLPKSMERSRWEKKAHHRDHIAISAEGGRSDMMDWSCVR